EALQLGIDPDARAVAAPGQPFAEERTALTARGDPAGHLGAFWFGDVVEDRAAKYLFGPPAKEPGGPLVPERDDAVQVDHNDRIAEVRPQPVAGGEYFGHSRSPVPRWKRSRQGKTCLVGRGTVVAGRG